MSPNPERVSTRINDQCEGSDILSHAYGDAFALISEAVLIADETGRYLDANDAALSMLRYERTELLSRSVKDLVVDGVADAEAEFARFLQAGTWSGIVGVLCGDGTILRTRARARTTVFEDGRSIGISVLEPVAMPARAANVPIANEQILQLSSALSAATTARESAQIMLQHLLLAVGGLAGAVGIVDGDTRVELVAEEGYSGLDTKPWRRFSVDAPLPLAEAIRERKPVVIHTIAERDGRYPELHGQGHGFEHAMVCLPMMVGGRVIGGISVSFAEPQSFTDAHLALMKALAAHGALALDGAQLRTIERLQRERAAFLSAAGQILSESLDFERTLADVARLVVHGVDVDGERFAGPADWCAVDLLTDDGTIRLLAVAHRDPERVSLAHELRRLLPSHIDDPTGVGAVIRTGRAEVTPEISDELIQAAVADPEIRSIVLDLGLTSAITIPLIVRERVLGALSLVASESGRRFDDDDVTLANELARRAAIAIDNAKLYRDRDTVARTLQHVLLPASLPRIDGFDTAALYSPGRDEMDVGGDFYDIFVRANGSFGVAIGDVCGHGPEAAAVMGVARQTIHVAGMSESRPSVILGMLNQILMGRGFERFVTVCDVRVVPSRGGAVLSVCAAGHPLPLIVRSEGLVETVGAPGPLLGAFDGVDLTDHEGRMEPGDALVLYTDGLVEWGPGLDQTDGLVGILTGVAGEPAARIVEVVQGWWQDGVEGKPRDDAAMLVVRAVTDT